MLIIGWYHDKTNDGTKLCYRNGQVSLNKKLIIWGKWGNACNFSPNYNGNTHKFFGDAGLWLPNISYQNSLAWKDGTSSQYSTSWWQWQMRNQNSQDNPIADRMLNVGGVIFSSVNSSSKSFISYSQWVMAEAVLMQIGQFHNTLTLEGEVGIGPRWRVLSSPTLPSKVPMNNK